MSFDPSPGTELPLSSCLRSSADIVSCGDLTTVSQSIAETTSTGNMSRASRLWENIGGTVTNWGCTGRAPNFRSSRAFPLPSPLAFSSQLVCLGLQGNAMCTLCACIFPIEMLKDIFSVEEVCPSRSGALPWTPLGPLYPQTPLQASSLAPCHGAHLQNTNSATPLHNVDLSYVVSGWYALLFILYYRCSTSQINIDRPTFDWLTNRLIIWLMY